MSENESDTMDEQNSDNDEFTVAVVAAENFGDNLQKEERAKKITSVIRDAVEENDSWKSPDKIAYTADLAGIGNIIPVTLKAYNNTRRKQGEEESMVELVHVDTRWNDTDGRDEDELDTRPDGSVYWKNAGEDRNKAMEVGSDALIVLGDDGLTGRLIGRFRRNGKDVHQYHGLDADLGPKF